MHDIRRWLALGYVAGLGAVLFSLTACDPCSGIAQCASGHYLALDGQIVDTARALGIPGVRIDVIRTGGISVQADSVSTVTDAQGLWHIELAPATAGVLLADVKVSPLGVPPYRLLDVPLTTREHRGDGLFNERWVSFLSVPAYGEFFRGGTADERVVGATVTFQRTGGIHWSGPGVRNDAWTDVTNDRGQVPLFPSSGANAVVITERGQLIGDVTVTLANGKGVLEMKNVSLGPDQMYRPRTTLPPILRAPVPDVGIYTISFSRGTTSP